MTEVRHGQGEDEERDGALDRQRDAPGGSDVAAAPEGDPCAARIQAALEERDRVLSIAAHEIRTPLASLRLYLDALIKAADRGSLDATEAAVRLRKAHRQCDRLNVLINNMMDVARTQSKPISLVLEPLDLVPVVTGACERLRDQFTQQGRSLRLEAPAGALLGDWDRPRLEQILNNLLWNVFKHAPGASALVQLEPRGGDRVLLRVSDDGPGIRPEERASLFQRRARSDQTKTGMGMGLWIVAQIVEAFGGTVRLEERALAGRAPGAGGGASFVVDLPMRRPLAPVAPGTPRS